MHLHNVHIKNIKQANEDNRLAIFVGAGISKSSDTDYISLPSWSDLITELKSDLAITEELDYLKLAQGGGGPSSTRGPVGARVFAYVGAPG